MLLYALFALHLGTDAATATQPATPPAFTVEAELVDIPAKFPPDDLYDYAFVMKYRARGGDRDQQTLLVAHYKPRQPRTKIKDKMAAHVKGNVRRFKVGDVHKLELREDLDKIWTGALVDEYFATDRKSPRYWCLRVDSAK